MCIEQPLCRVDGAVVATGVTLATSVAPPKMRSLPLPMLCRAGHDGAAAPPQRWSSAVRRSPGIAFSSTYCRLRLLTFSILLGFCHGKRPFSSCRNGSNRFVFLLSVQVTVLLPHSLPARSLPACPLHARASMLR